ncbi:MAG TPA: efflux RND transporter periplasmic adaptor subunit [Pseudogracilibacillus sp.]|nr:efflux RND transporter periplasmic adaptor subunit [Pseudogracilibacillus sp.]
MKKKMLLLIFISFALILSACGDSDKEETEEEDNVVPVETTEVDKGNLKTEKSLYGQTQAIKQTPIMLSQPGELDELKVANNDEVNKDDALAVIKSEAGEQTIKAPSKGIVASLPESSGAFVSNEEPFAMILDLDEIKVQATMTQKMRDLFTVDQEVKVEIDNEEYTGKVLALDPLPNENGELVMNVRVKNEDDKISTGESAKITVNKTLKKDVLIVPSEAIMTSEEEDYVYVIEDSKAKKVKVEILEAQTNETAIKGDIKEKDAIVINGQSLLSDDVKVDVKKDGDKS